MPKSAPVAVQVPQTDKLGKIRAVVDALAAGAATRVDLQRVTKFSERHVNYAIASGKVLGLLAELRKTDVGLTARGSELARTTAGSADEKALLFRAVVESPGIKKIAPTLLGPTGPSRQHLAERIRALARISRSTADRRAQALLAWRKQLIAPQAALPFTRRPAGEQLHLATPFQLSQAMINDLYRDNPWWTGEKGMVLPAVRRDFVETIHRRLALRLAPIVVVRGPRQVGKTTAQLQVIEDLLTRGVSPNQILRVQCDALPEITRLSEPILRIIEWYERHILQSSLNAAAHAGRPTFLFLDEVQNLSDWAVQLKHLVDNATTQAVVTGSSALRIEQGRDSLAGRINTIEVGTLTIREIAAIRFGSRIPAVLGEGNLEELARKDTWLSLREHGNKHRELRDKAFEAFSERGGYPLVQKNATAPWPDVAYQLNETVIKRVIQHDLRVGDRGRKRDPFLLQELFRLACRYAGQAPSVTLFVREIQNALKGNIGPQRVRHYLDFLDRALLLRMVRPLELRLKRTRGEPKLCLADHGLRASWLQEVVPLGSEGLARLPHLADLAGRLAESIVGAYLHTFGGLGLSYFPERDDEPEVDFVLTLGPSRIPLEVKFCRTIREPEHTRGLCSFMDRKVYNAPFGVLITQADDVTVADERIVCLPLSTLLLLR
jgi:predicted AAA+ superfamily ATPase